MSLGPKLREAQLVRASMPDGGGELRFIMLGAFVFLVVVLLTVFGPHKISAAGVEKRLTAAAQASLSGADFKFISVRMDGQTAYLDGVAPSATVTAAAAKKVLKAAGKGGPWDGGVTRVVEKLTQADVVTPFDWKAVRNDKALTISGHAPSEFAKSQLLKRATRLFPGGVKDQSVVAAGAPSGDWLGIAMSGLEGVAALNGGDARLVGRRLILMGEGDRAAVDKVKSSYEGKALTPFEAVLDVSVAGEAPADMAGISLAGADAGKCQEAFSRIMARNVINFDTGSAVIAAASTRVLDDLASIARRCDTYSVEVAGHTDDVGPRDINMNLSQARAQAVVNYLGAQGVTAGRLSAVGYGPFRPLAPNATAEGQARNRRIEFTVKS